MCRVDARVLRGRRLDDGGRASRDGENDGADPSLAAKSNSTSLSGRLCNLRLHPEIVCCLLCKILVESRADSLSLQGVGSSEDCVPRMTDFARLHLPVFALKTIYAIPSSIPAHPPLDGR